MYFVLISLGLTIAMGAAYGTAKAGISIAGVGTFKSELIMKVPSFLDEFEIND
jgi:V-type H+-transporting ATPase 16kDa proteolipid subunit